MQSRKRNREEKEEDKKTAEQNHNHNLEQPIGSMPDDKKVLLAETHLGAGNSYNLFHAAPDLFQSIHPSKAQLESLRKLLSHAALGEWKQAEAIWSNNPSLLTIPGTIYHPNNTYDENGNLTPIPEEKNLGRYKYVNCTAWQIALMNEEWEEAELMGKFMSEDEKRKQFLAIFPNGEMQYSQRLDDAKQLLQHVFSAVITDQSIEENNLEKMNDATRHALKALRDFIKPKPEHQAGLVFDPAIYLAALQIYDNTFNKFQNWGQRSFWNIRVEEMTAGILGTGYLRPHAQGIGRNSHHRRGCILPPTDSSYFAFRRNFNSLPAFNFFVEYNEGVGSRRWLPPRGAAWGVEGPRMAFQKLCRAKNSARTILYNSLRLQKLRHV